MPVTYKKIASVTVGSGGAASLDFQNIPATYTDLVIKISARSNRSNVVDGFAVRFNNDLTSGNYSGRRLFGSGSSASSDTQYAGMPFGSGSTATASTFGNAEIYIPNYAGSTTKSLSADGVQENNATTAYQGLGAGLWNQTNAITRVTVYPESTANTFDQYTTAVLYGISKS